MIATLCKGTINKPARLGKGLLATILASSGGKNFIFDTVILGNLHILFSRTTNPLGINTTSLQVSRREQ
jgi:hypothetical protein